jgi:hypothetical protein
LIWTPPEYRQSSIRFDRAGLDSPHRDQGVEKTNADVGIRSMERVPGKTIVNFVILANLESILIADSASSQLKKRMTANETSPR